MTDGSLAYINKRCGRYNNNNKLSSSFLLYLGQVRRRDFHSTGHVAAMILILFIKCNISELKTNQI